LSRKFEMKILKFFIFKIWNFSFLKFGFFIFEIWNGNFCLNFYKQIDHITEWKWKNNWNEEIIYFVYATEIKLPIIPLYHPYHLCIPPYTTCASCGGIQLILVVGSFHTGPFPTVIWGGMVTVKEPGNDFSMFMSLWCNSLRAMKFPLSKKEVAKATVVHVCHIQLFTSLLVGKLLIANHSLTIIRRFS
jgi:hypothetical protein